ncbi:hypothetical protein BDK51DRAFT_30762 [Blyttiomyces helicus]|uniref:BAG domain-containing protein n=1 Tax=Blyttiomyces helicus TaxID=388810 RepID=A0A4P9WJL8_9FUNG|nr:hypothetical protein BDK51DRAFT_30762 [Blyttiomyces helicus]|eukprot:RKO91718.1 hypothetical protein BDK51DRAFT_30762 [Blyttiomyces helicus]
MFGLGDHPLLNYSLALALGVVCTAVCTGAITFGIRTLIRDHNLTVLRRQFRKENKRLRDALKSVERECVKAVGPRIEAIAVEVGVEEAAAAESGSPGATAGAPADESNGNGKVEVAVEKKERAVSETPSGAAAATVEPTPLSSPPSAPVSPTRTAPPSRPPLPLLKAPVDRRLREVDDHLLRLLERLDALRPGDMAAVVRADPAVADAEADAATLKLMEDGISEMRARKKAVVRKVQGMLGRVDRLCEAAGIPSVGLQHRRGGKPLA